MKISVISLVFILGIFWVGTVQAADPAHKFVGAAKCKTCHKKKKDGEQYQQWQKSGHANAFKTLGTAEAKEVAKKNGVTGDPQKAPQCLKCHVTAYGVDAKYLDKSYKMENGVQCESCHGPGKDYKKKKVMKDHAKSIAAGMIVPDEKTCTTCHNKESPTYKPFNYKKKYKKVNHPNPSKK
ncbi:MAG: cytochrome c family protein [Fibrobacterales bacterium]